jgi:D-alanyl-D-alanine carboxypeptidase/D-alanyl-D-alanine-endopeptidase (penicillin-binding protein 4)
MSHCKLLAFSVIISVTACSHARFIAGTGRQLVQEDVFRNAHVGILIYDAAAKKNIYSYQADKYFVPASNTKIFTLYAGLKFLGDSLPGLRYRETADSFLIVSTGDPTLLHPGFESQPVIKKLQQVKKAIMLEQKTDSVLPYGMGWAWDDYNSSYMVERNALPVYGNTIKWIQSAQTNTQQELSGPMQTFVFSEPDVNWKLRFIEDTSNKTFRVQRRKDENYFEVYQGTESLGIQSIPFITNGVASALELLKDTIYQEVAIIPYRGGSGYTTIYSQPSDTLYKHMMHNSDNFFAEQVLLMAANEALGTMDEKKIIDELLNNDLKQLQQPPHWVDGSGLSRYNLFTPSDFVWICDRMQKNYGLERLKKIFPGANQGTLEGYYSGYSGKIFAKTGTLSSHVALSGFIITRKEKLLLFSVLVNNHRVTSSDVRRKIESFLTNIIDKY